MVSFNNPFKSSYAWYLRNRELHGSEMLFFVFFVYFMQGARGFIDNAAVYIYKSEFGGGKKMGPITYVKSNGKIFWNFKFVIGLISDNVPILGYNCKPYLLLALLVGTIAQPLLGIKEASPNLALFAVFYMMVQAYGAVADVLADALVVKAGREDEEDSSSSLQSVSWFALGLGGCMAHLIGGFMATGDDGKIDSTGPRFFNIGMTILPLGMFILVLRLKEKKTDFRPGFKVLFQQLIQLFVAVFSPPFLVIRVGLWAIIHQAVCFDIDAWTLFQVEIGITPFQTAIASSVAYFFLSVGVVIYYKFFRHTTFRKIFFFSQIVWGLIALIDLIQFHRLNVGYVSDLAFLLGANVLSEVIVRLNSMPYLVLGAQLCPPHMEATFFSFLMSVSNVGITASGNIGAAMSDAFGVTSDNFENLGTLVLIRGCMMIGASIFVLLVPNTSAMDPTNVESLKPTNKYIIRLLKFADMYYVDEHGVGHVIAVGGHASQEEEKVAGTLAEKEKSMNV